jgi:poly-gamma-glutamate synthesis protein (capsule biosynthesis protein)
VLKDIDSLGNEADYVVVSCHWGIEFVDFPSPNIKRLARQMADAGADIILGHHPHVPQGIEKYKDSIIFYSLGNFLFDFLWSRRSRESMIAKIRISGGKVEYDLSPVRINDKYQVELMDEKHSKEYLEHMKKIAVRMEDVENYDIEDKHYEYYIKAEKELLRTQYKKFAYIIKNIHRLDKRFLKYMAEKSFRLSRSGTRALQQYEGK